MFEFAWIWAWAALPLPLLVRLLPAKKESQLTPLRVPHLISGIATESNKTGSSKGILLVALLAWLCLVAAAARPQWLGDAVSIPSKGRDLMVAVDLSGSMETEDMEVNGREVDRLVMIKYVLREFIARRVGDRIGLILFADTAYLQTPLTYDRDTVVKLLDETQIGLVGEQTAIGDAVGLAVKRFEQREESNRVLILLTDGQNTAGNITPEQAKELAVNHDITVYTIGVGADEMVRRSIFGSRRINPSRDLDETMLTDLAQSTNGQYFRARDVVALQEIYATLDELEPVERETRQMRPLKALFHYPLAAALVLTLLLALKPLLSQLLARVRA